MESHTIIILGGDGFCGWPTALKLSAMGMRVIIVDNFSRRKIDEELGIQSLTPICEMQTRLASWENLTGAKIAFHEMTIGEDFNELLALIKAEKPRTIIHFAEQRAAPYSMKSAAHKRYTVRNNINATHDVLAAIVESGLDIHLIHLGTMGVYGYGHNGATLPEGYIRASWQAQEGVHEQEILYPTNPGSIYHMTKTQDQLLFAFYNKNDQIRITDLHQGIVWGTQTEETRRAPELINRFDYDGDYGTVLNRFFMQAAIGYPLTVYGTGGQCRAFIHIQNSVEAIALSVLNPPKRGEKVLIRNQITETHTLLHLAELVAKNTGAPIQFLDNPRNEAAANDLHAENQSLIHLGLKPITLESGLMNEIIEIAKTYAHRADESKILSSALWRKPQRQD